MASLEKWLIQQISAAIIVSHKNNYSLFKNTRIITEVVMNTYSKHFYVEALRTGLFYSMVAWEAVCHLPHTVIEADKIYEWILNEWLKSSDWTAAKAYLNHFKTIGIVACTIVLGNNTLSACTVCVSTWTTPTILKPTTIENGEISLKGTFSKWIFREGVYTTRVQ